MFLLCFSSTYVEGPGEHDLESAPPPYAPPTPDSARGATAAGANVVSHCLTLNNPSTIFTLKIIYIYIS